MAKIILSDFYYRGKHYDSMEFDLDVTNKSDVEISLLLGKKIEEQENQKKTQ